jgi:hypothetical protein
VPSGLDPGVAEDWREVEDHIRKDEKSDAEAHSTNTEINLEMRRF